MNAAIAACENGSAAEARRLVELAVQLVKSEGESVAIRTFSEPAGEFLNGSLYVFVIDFQGTLLANSLVPDSRGANIYHTTSVNGRYYVQDMILLARSQNQGWVNYQFGNPCTGTIMSKSTFVKRINNLIIGSGFYLGTLI